MTSPRAQLRQLEPGPGDRPVRRRRRRDGARRRLWPPLAERLHRATARASGVDLPGCHNPTRGPVRPARATAEEGRPIDIIFLVERLESLIANGKKLPMTNNVVIDQDAALDLIDELRVAVPEEVRAAKRINQEGERIIEKAQEEAERIVARAQEQAAFLIEERGPDRGRRGGEPPDREPRPRTRRPTSAAAPTSTPPPSSSVSRREVVRTLQAIKRGIALLDERRTQRGPPSPTTTGDDEALGGRRRSSRRIGRPDPSVVTAPAPAGPLTVNVATLLGEPAGVGPRLRLRRPVPRSRPSRPDRRRDRRGPGRGSARPRRPDRRPLPPGADESRASGRRRRRHRPGARPAAAAFGPWSWPVTARDRRRGPAERRPRQRRARSTRSAEPEAARLTDHHELDLEPLVREAILLASPDRAAVRPDCPGLCPVCGSDLASGPHDHAEESIDPRLEALRAFRVDGGRRERVDSRVGPASAAGLRLRGHRPTRRH